MTVQNQPNREFTHIGHYQILNHIGCGGMGIVYVAFDTRLNRKVAIKCLRNELIETNYRERFKREALLLAKLNHSNIVQIYDFVETHEQLALVMEWVEGENLQQHLLHNRTPVGRRILWLTKIAQGLAVAHDAGIIHRDLKAENILISTRGDIKIADFGIAKSFEFNLTITDQVAGTFGSMSPEQAKGEPIDFRSDLFSFGILAYQLLCGTHPFGDTQNKLQLMQRIISESAVASDIHNPDLPPELHALLSQLLSKNPSSRPANTHWVAAQCEKFGHVFPQDHNGENNTLAPLPLEKVSAKVESTKTQTNHALFEQFQHSVQPKYALVTLTRIKKWLNVARRLHKHLIALSSLMTLVVFGIIIYYLKSPSPRYIAVLQPTLTTSEMSEEQQKLIQSAIYDAIAQTVLQLKDFYLIPRTEIDDTETAQTTEDMEALRKATVADELISSQLHCTITACTFNVSRLSADAPSPAGRLRVLDRQSADLLTDNLIASATLVQRNIGKLYAKTLDNRLEKIEEQDYRVFLQANKRYQEFRAVPTLLDIIDGLHKNTKMLPEVQTLYTNVALDLFYDTQEQRYIDDAHNFLSAYTVSEKTKEQYYNEYHVQIDQHDFNAAQKTLVKLQQLYPSAAFNELQGDKALQQADYKAAIEFYGKANTAKPSARTLYDSALAYYYYGDIENAKKYSLEATRLSPRYAKALLLNGAIELSSGDINKAAEMFQRILTRQPNDVLAINNLGLCAMIQKNYTNATTFFDQANNLAPDNLSYLLNKADAYDLSGNYELSHSLYKRIIEAKNSNNVRADDLIAQAQAHAHLRNFANAFALLEKQSVGDRTVIYTAALINALANNKTSAVLKTKEALATGTSILWFSFSWFNSLCTEREFVDIMQNNGEPDRCAPQKNQGPLE